MISYFVIPFQKYTACEPFARKYIREDLGSRSRSPTLLTAAVEVKEAGIYRSCFTGNLHMVELDTFSSNFTMHAASLQTLSTFSRNLSSAGECMFVIVFLSFLKIDEESLSARFRYWQTHARVAECTVT